VGEDGAVSTVIPSPIPHGRTARRLEWAHLPPSVRSEIEQRCGSPVVSAASQGGGYTPGFASVLTCADGSRHFVKAASTAAQRPFAASYREEARKLRALPDTIPAPRLLWTIDADWVVLGLEYVEARAPRRPWRLGELNACLDALETLADLLTPCPPDLGLDPITEEMATWPAFWDHVNATRDLPHGDEAAALAADFAGSVAGQTLVHTDVRDDNVLLAKDGRTLFCDWNWPTIGADWLDSLFMLIGPRGDGLDVAAVIAERRLLRDAPPEHLDRALAVICGYFLRSADEPVPPTSPYVRDIQRWQGDVVWEWLSERRGWGA
jgi:aminoglycoside phosphotransferase (APT) family kinase protein